MPKIPQTDDDEVIAYYPHDGPDDSVDLADCSESHFKGCSDLLDTCGGCLIAIVLVLFALIRLLIVS